MSQKNDEDFDLDDYVDVDFDVSTNETSTLTDIFFLSFTSEKTKEDQ